MDMKETEIATFWSNHKKQIDASTYASTFEEFKININKNKDINIFFDKVVEYSEFINELIDNLNIEADFFSNIELSLQKLPIGEENNNQEILNISSDILMNISLIEGKYKELTNKILIKYSTATDDYRLQIVNNTLSENKLLIESKAPEFHKVLKKIKFYKILNNVFGERIRNDFGHGKVHFFVNACNAQELIEHLNSLNQVLQMVSKFIHSISCYVMNSMGRGKFRPYHPLERIMFVDDTVDNYYIRYEIIRHIKAWCE